MEDGGCRVGVPLLCVFLKLAFHHAPSFFPPTDLPPVVGVFALEAA